MSTVPAPAPARIQEEDLISVLLPSSRLIFLSGFARGRLIGRHKIRPDGIAFEATIYVIRNSSGGLAPGLYRIVDEPVSSVTSYDAVLDITKLSMILRLDDSIPPTQCPPRDGSGGIVSGDGTLTVTITNDPQSPFLDHPITDFATSIP